jgi:hypothetical protein
MVNVSDAPNDVPLSRAAQTKQHTTPMDEHGVAGAQQSAGRCNGDRLTAAPAAACFLDFL